MITITKPANDHPVATNGSGAPIVKQHKPCNGKTRTHVQALLKRVRDAHIAGQHKKAQQLCRVYLNSLDARCLATAEANRSLKMHRRPARAALRSIASGLDAWKGTKEEVFLHLRDKNPANPTGHQRTLMDFGIENRALQHLVLPALKARADLHPNQFGTRGVHLAIKRVRDLLLDGHVWAIETDIEDCYPSFDSEKVPSLLPLPKKVTQSVLLSGSLYLSLGKSNLFGPVESEEEVEHLLSEFFADARQGFPQGSATSPLAVEMLLANVYYQLPTDHPSVGYVDNFLAMAGDETGVVSMTKTFWSALKAHPAGQLRPKRPKVFGPGEPIEFLGHELRLKNGTVKISPSYENAWKFENAIMRGAERLACTDISPAVRKRAANELRRYVHSWTAAFQLCNDVQIIKEQALNRIGKAAH